jgi:hypothetical protein
MTEAIGLIEKARGGIGEVRKVLTDALDVLGGGVKSKRKR